MQSATTLRSADPLPDARILPRPPALPTRLLCDEMLQGLGRWLRAAGYDTVTARAGTRDSQVTALARHEARLLVTCDRGFAASRHRLEGLVILSSSGLEAQAAELGRHFAVDWLHAPFSRCLRDNSRLRQASALEAAAVPPAARGLSGAVTACPSCSRLYWPGSHVRRMRARLAAWQADQAARPLCEPGTRP